MQDDAERAMLRPREGEMHDISSGALRVISVLFAVTLVLMIAGII